MFRLPLLLALLCAAVGRPAEPPKKPELPPTEFPKIVVKKLESKPGEDPTPEQYAEYEKQFQPPKLPEVKDTDKPLVKLTKYTLKAVVEAQQAYRRRIDGGIGSNSEFAAFCDLSTQLVTTADLAFDKPSDRLPWYEYRVLMMKMTEQYYVARAGAGGPDGQRGVDPPYMLPLASAARLAAEIALLKLKEQIAK